jgi:CheY-like chemotaxis protein
MNTKLLIVDDHANARELIRSFLNIPGMTFQESASGREAIAHARDFKPHWVTVDIKMPGMDGFETIKGIKEVHPDARVIIVTSFNEPQFRDRAHSAGAVGFILKENLLALRLFLEKDAKDESKQPARLTPASAGDARQSPPKRILVLDDDSETQGMLGLLVGKGYKITRTAKGAEAISLHRQNPFDLVIIELLLPDYDGFETFSELRHAFVPPKFIAIAKAGWAAADICLKMAKQLGANETLAKPFGAEDLLEAVEKVLK